MIIIKANLVQKNAFLYSLWSGILRIYEGDVVEPSTRNGTFITKIKNMSCGLEPNIVYNAVVWLPERNDKLAIELLIQNEEKEILKLQEKIQNHLNKITILRDGVVN